MQPDTHYARSADGVSIAYQVLGDAPRDLVLVPGWIFHLEVVWEHPSFETFMRRLLQNFRVIMFDKRGTGLSDRTVGASTMEERMDDVRAVMDATGSERASVMGWSEGGNIAAMFAATYPYRLEGLILYAAGARYRQAPDYPIGMSDEAIEFGRQFLRSNWGEGAFSWMVAPSRANDDAFRRWFGRYERTSVSPGEAEAMMAVNLEIDSTDILRLVRTPTLVLHNRNDMFVSVESSRYIAERVPGSKLVELDGDDHLFWFSNAEDVVGEVEEFLLGARAVHEPDRVLSTVLFTDIVGSTDHAVKVGDQRWREMLHIHDRVAGESVTNFRGALVQTTGDGILATFDGPARAVVCATRIQSSLSQHGLQVRAGVHTGEIELRGQNIGGIAVHIASRIAALAGPGEVLASSTVKDLSAGAGIRFTDKGTHDLKGLSEPWRLYTAAV